MSKYDNFHKCISALKHELCKLKMEAFVNVIGTRYTYLVFSKQKKNKTNQIKIVFDFDEQVWG